MNIQSNSFNKGILVVAGLFALSACATPLTAPDGSETARSKLTQLQSNPQLANLAPVEIKDAEAAVLAAEEPRTDTAYARHLVLIANTKVDREVDRARADATIARDDADAARLESEDLQRQIEELNARETDRGLVVTLGDLLFATGRSELTGGAGPNLNRLATFLREYPDRTVYIEGHTDSVGSAESNYLLSQRRAESVRSYLVGQGIAPHRLTTAGLGQGSPVASNDTATGRQQNRRVEVIISNVQKASNLD